MYYSISLKGKGEIICQKIELDEFFKQGGPKIKYGVAYLICKKLDCNSIWTGSIHIEEITHCKISLDDIFTIKIRSNLCETDEPWKTLLKRKTSFNNFSYEETDRICKIIKKELNYDK